MVQGHNTGYMKPCLNHTHPSQKMRMEFSQAICGLEMSHRYEPVILLLRSLKQKEGLKFKATLGFMMNSRPARAIYIKTCLKSIAT